MANKTLITTFLQNKSYKNPFFLNRWLEKNNFFKFEKKSDYFYHWDSLAKKKKDQKYLSIFYEKVLKDLSKKLNYKHNVNYNLNYWRIILGPWLYTYITSNFDRWEILSKALSDKKLFFTYHSYTTEKFINLNYKDYIEKITSSDNYNYKKYDSILKFRDEKNLNIIKKDKFIKVNNFKSQYLQKLDHLIFILQKVYFNFFAYRNKNIFFTSFFKKKNVVSFINSFGKNCNFLIFFSFKNIIKKRDYNKDLRKEKLSFKPRSLFEKYIKKEIFNELPISYLERYKYIRSSILDKKKKKNNIITSVEHLEDDVIKVWLAEKIFNKSKLYIYDHSNSLRLLINDFGHEELISEKIISCLKNDKKKFINLPELKSSLFRDEKKQNFNKPQFGSIILYEGPKYAGKLISAPAGASNNIHFNQIIQFYSKLEKKIKNFVKFKSPPYTSLRINTQKRVITLFGNDKIFNLDLNLQNVIQSSKIIVCTYPQTTLIEIILSKKPFIILYPKNLWQFDKNSQKVLKKLKEKKILFFDEKIASRHINKYWDNLELWWNSKNVQLLLYDLMKNHFKFESHNQLWGNFLKKI